MFVFSMNNYLSNFALSNMYSNIQLSRKNVPGLLLEKPRFQTKLSILTSCVILHRLKPILNLNSSHL